MDRWLSRWRQHCAWYLVVQGVAGMVWWVGLTTSTRFQNWFVAPDGWLAARAVAAADVLLFGVGSIVFGVLVARHHRWSTAAMWALVGVTAYATVVSVAWVFGPVERWLGVTVMIPALVLTSMTAVVVAERSESSL